MGEMAVHAGEDQGLGSIAEAVEPQHALPGLRCDVGFGGERRQVDTGRRQTRPLLRRSFRATSPRSHATRAARVKRLTVLEWS